VSTLLTRYILRDLPRPRFLTGRRIVAYLRTFCEIADEVAQDVIDARSELMIETASPSALTSAAAAALSALARNVNDRSYARETVTALRTYLLQQREAKRRAGTEDALHEQFARLGCPAIEIVTELDLRRHSVVNGFGGNIGFFFIIVRQPHPFPAEIDAWDGGGDWDDGTSTWGATLSDGDQAEIADLLRRWKASGTSCRFIVFDQDGTTTWGPGGLAGNYQLIPFNEAWEFLPPSGIVTPYYNTDFLTP